MGAFVNYFFSGFIMGRVPFPLSPSFRIMLQVRRGALEGIGADCRAALHLAEDHGDSSSTHPAVATRLLQAQCARGSGVQAGQAVP